VPIVNRKCYLAQTFSLLKLPSAPRTFTDRTSVLLVRLFLFTIRYLRFTTRYVLAGGDPQESFRSRNWTCIDRWVTSYCLPPLAFLNDEEMRWQATSVSLINGVGSIIVARWRTPQTISLRRNG